MIKALDAIINYIFGLCYSKRGLNFIETKL